MKLAESISGIVCASKEPFCFHNNEWHVEQRYREVAEGKITKKDCGALHGTFPSMSESVNKDEEVGWE